MCRGEIIGVEPDIFLPAVLDELFIYVTLARYSNTHGLAVGRLEMKSRDLTFDFVFADIDKG
jgi:hypothetical protein